MSATPKTVHQSDYPHIVQTERATGGAATIEGTRIAVWHVVEYYYRAGLSAEEILTD